MGHLREAGGCPAMKPNTLPDKGTRLTRAGPARSRPAQACPRRCTTPISLSGSATLIPAAARSMSATRLSASPAPTKPPARGCDWGRPHRFRRGHRIRIQVSSGAFPQLRLQLRDRRTACLRNHPAQRRADHPPRPRSPVGDISVKRAHNGESKRRTASGRRRPAHRQDSSDHRPLLNKMRPPR